MPSPLRPDPALVDIHYLRPPDRTHIFRQEVVAATDEVVVTLARAIERSSPVLIEGQVVLEEGSDVVWFTFPGLWHDIGRFHRADGTFTGIYANILTPCSFEPGGIWRTTDLFLDLWIPAPGMRSERILLLDEEELQDAEERRWVGGETAARAREEAERLRAAYDRGEWPPDAVYTWTRERVLERAGE
jgi:predicted RNA-binding protein associated with RNAse of E/G family